VGDISRTIALDYLIRPLRVAREYLHSVAQAIRKR
jgi:hypothetical protein